MESLVKVPSLSISGKLKSHIIYEVLYNKALEELKKLTNIASFRMSNEFTVLVCNLIEHAVKKKDKVDKKKLVVALLKALFTLSPAEEITLGNDIDHMVANTKLIQRVLKPIYTRVYRKVTKRIFKKEQSK